MIHIGIFKILSLGNTKHLVAFLLVEKLSLLIEQLKRIPHTWIVTGSDDDTTTGSLHGNSYLSGGCGGQSDIYHIKAHTHKGTTHHILDHFARDTGIPAHHDLVAGNLCGLTYECSISRSKLHYIQRIECITRTTSYRSTDARDGFN